MQNDLLLTTQDAITHRLERAQREQLEHEVEGLGHHANIANASGGAAGATEWTPLVVKAGHDAVVIDDDLDLEVLDRSLHKQERAMELQDQQADTHGIAIEEAKSMVALAMPIIGSQLVETAPMVALGWMLGNVGGSDSTTILAASSLSDFAMGQAVFTVSSGIVSALETMCAQAYGAKQYAQICLFAQAGLIATAYYLVVVTILSLNGSTFFKLLGQDPDLSELTGVFMALNLLSIPFIFALSVVRSVLFSQHIAAPFVYIPIVSYAATLPLAYALGFYTRLGYVGILLATCLNNVLKVAMAIPALVKSPAFAQGWPGWQWRESHQLMVRLLPLMFASVLMTTFQTFGMNSTSLFCGYLPNAAQSIAASNIAGALFTLATVPLAGFFVSGAIRVGTALGAGNARRAEVVSRVGTGLTIAVAVVAAIVSASFAESFSYSYTTDQDTAEAAASLYSVLSVVVVLVGWMFGVQGVLRACGKQQLIANLSFVFLLAMGIPLGLLLAIPWELGVSGLFYGQMAGMFGSSLASTVFVLRIDWRGAAQEAYQNTHLHVEKQHKQPESEPRRI